MTRRIFILLLLVGCSTSGNDGKFVTCNMTQYEPMMEQAYQSAVQKMAKFFPPQTTYHHISLKMELGKEIPWAKGEYQLTDQEAMATGACYAGGSTAFIRIAIGPPPKFAQKRLFGIMEHEAAECIRLWHGRNEPAEFWHRHFRTVGVFTY